MEETSKMEEVVVRETKIQRRGAVNDNNFTCKNIIRCCDSFQAINIIFKCFGFQTDDNDEPTRCSHHRSSSSSSSTTDVKETADLPTSTADLPQSDPPSFSQNLARSFRRPPRPPLTSGSGPQTNSGGTS